MEQFCQDKINVGIVGAGPAGIFCALNLAIEFKKYNFSNYSISIFDKSQALRTILPTGGGRCNLTNATYDIKEFASNFPRGEKFLYSIFSRYFIFETLDLFSSIGVDTYIQEDNRIFPTTNSSKDVKGKMLNALSKFKNIKLIHQEIKSADELKGFNKIIVAAGSRNTTRLIQSFSQPMIPFKRALCALKVDNFRYPKGVSVKSLDGDFIFTEDGISGPLAFKISSINVQKDFPYEIKLKLFNVDELLDLISKNTKKSIGNIISMLIPKSLALVVVDEFDKKAAEVSKKKLEEYSVLSLTIADRCAQGEIVHAGGVDLKYIDKNCKSKVCDNLWFCGEILNIDGFCGGFNLQNCWSSAGVVAKDVIRSIIE